MRPPSLTLRRLVAGALPALALAAGCGSSSEKSSGSQVGGNSNMTTAIDRSRCDDRGKQTVSADTNQDSKPDVLKLYTTVRQAGQTTQVLVCKQVDLNNDGKIDIVYHYDDAGVLSFEEFDLDFDGRFDLRAFYQGGRKVREEMDTNYDMRVDFTKYYENDKLVRIELDSNNDGRVDQWQYYEGGKLDRIGYDTTGSGRVDKWERAPEAEAASAPAGGEAAPPAPGGTTPPPATTPPTTPPPPSK
jgi:hypothetical protein